MKILVDVEGRRNSMERMDLEFQPLALFNLKDWDASISEQLTIQWRDGSCIPTVGTIQLKDWIPDYNQHHYSNK